MEKTSEQVVGDDELEKASVEMHQASEMLAQGRTSFVGASAEPAA